MRTMKYLKLLIIVLLFGSCASDDNPAVQQASDEEKVVNIYTKRHYDSDKKLYELFTEKTGIKVNVIQGESSGSLVERMVQEGSNSPCDVFITSDAGNLGAAKAKGVTQAVSSELLNNTIPVEYRDPDGHWYGISMRARIIAYNTELLDPSEIQDYSDLTKPELQGKVLVRSSTNIYNQSLLASMIANQGEEAALDWAKGIVKNMAREPKGGDTDQLKAVAAGQGHVAIANSYYVARLRSSDKEEDRAVADKLNVIFPRAGENGTHVNISGAAVGANSPNKEHAVRFIEFLISPSAQLIITSTNNEYPIRTDVELPAVLAKWGEFDRDDLNLSKLYEFNTQASRLFDKAGWK